MAITKVIAIRSRLDSRVNYVTNSKKTTLTAGLTYITNPEKTEQSFFVSTINCGSPETAYREMQQVKQRFHNTGGVLGYHFIQSFAPGEVTPEQAHRIGVAFAKEVFGDAYQVVIGTHLDRAHLHSHIIINSVSFLDGKKYHSSPISYYNTIRKTSDELCKAENLSVLSPENKGKNYAEWKAQREGKPTLSQMLRDEIDLVIRDCFTFPDFLNLLEKKGYAVSRNPNRKYLTIRPPGAKRNFRLDRLGEGYTVEDIKRRIQEQQRAILEGRVSAYQPLPVRRYRFSGFWKTVRKKKITGFYALYLRYVYLLRRYKRPTRKRISYEMRREVLRLERYQAQFLYLHEHGISTLEQLMERQAQIEQEIQQRTELRQPLYAKRRCETDENIKEELVREIDRQTASLRQLRKERALCKRIEQQVPGIQQNLREFEENKSQNQKEVIRHEYQRRNR